MHLFAGVGGGLLADLIMGHRPIVAVEWEPYACQVLRERTADGWFPDLRVWEGDVRMFDPSEYAGKVDCIHAGFPCQDISVAGKQAGVSEGTRSGLYREVLRIADTVRPLYLFLENVAAILSNGLGTVLGDLAEMGYDARWCCLRASDVGTPHHRDRWWCLCTRRTDLLPHAEHVGHGRWEQLKKGSQEAAGDMADSKCFGQQGQREYVESICSKTHSDWQANWFIYGSKGNIGWWDSESNVGRVANGVPHRIHQLKGLGNGQVPLQAAVAWKLLGGE